MTDPAPSRQTGLVYANLTGRPPGSLVRVLGRVLPGVAAVQRQVAPYADHWHRANAEAIERGRRRWIVFGDSMSLGIGASTPSQGWVGQAHRQLREDGVEVDVVNLSANGAGVADVLQQQIPAWAGLPPARTGSAADVVSVLVGSNDLFGRRHRDGLPAQFEQLAQALPTGAIIGLLTQPSAAARAVNDVLQAQQAARRLRLVDLRSDGPSSWRGKLAGDHFHPNDLGYAGIAAPFVEPLREALRTT